MKTLKIKFLKEFYTVTPKRTTFKAGDVLEIAVDAENFPIHSFWQSQFIDNPLSGTFEIVSANITPENKPKAK